MDGLAPAELAKLRKASGKGGGKGGGMGGGRGGKGGKGGGPRRRGQVGEQCFDACSHSHLRPVRQ